MGSGQRLTRDPRPATCGSQIPEPIRIICAIRGSQNPSPVPKKTLAFLVPWRFQKAEPCPKPEPLLARPAQTRDSLAHSGHRVLLRHRQRRQLSGTRQRLIGRVWITALHCDQRIDHIQTRVISVDLARFGQCLVAGPAFSPRHAPTSPTLRNARARVRSPVVRPFPLRRAYECGRAPRRSC